MKIAIRLNAGNDMNGNPRRVFVVLDKHGILDIIDEGYNGDSELRKRHRISASDDFETTPAEYRQLVKRADATRRMMSGPPASRRSRRSVLGGFGR